jgi:hypothetical protein
MIDPFEKYFKALENWDSMFNFFKKKDNLGNFCQEKCQRNNQSRVGKIIKQGACSNSLSALTKGVQNIRA